MSMTIQSGIKDKILVTLSETPKVENTLAEMLRDMDQQMERRAHDGKANVVTDALSRKERVKPRCVRAMAMIIQNGVRDSVMSDSDESGVTYTKVSSPFEGLSDIGSPRADDHEYLELPGMLEDPYVEAALQAPPSPDYVTWTESNSRMGGPTLPDYVLGPSADDDEILLRIARWPMMRRREDDLAMQTSVVVALPSYDHGPIWEGPQSRSDDDVSAGHTTTTHTAYRVK
ncbi:hypothetical protein Tco_0916626 [Tanacetum coccineum]